MIKIKKDISVFGYKFFKGTYVHYPNDLTNTGSQILIVISKNKNSKVMMPIFCKDYKNKWAIDFLNEICFQNTGHASYEEWNDWNNHILYG